MPVLLIVIGVLLAIVAIRDTVGSFATHLDQDLTASQGGNVSFFVWVGAIIAIGLVGYLPGLKGLSRAFLALVVLVIILKSGTGLFSSFLSQLRATPPQEPAGMVPPNIPNPTINIQLGGGSGGGSGAANAAVGAASKAATGGLLGLIGI